MSEISNEEQTESEALEAASFAPDVDVVTNEGAVENPSDPSHSSTPTSNETVEEPQSEAEAIELSEFFDIPRSQRPANPWDPGASVVIFSVRERRPHRHPRGRAGRANPVAVERGAPSRRSSGASR